MVPALKSTRTLAATRLQACSCAPAPSRLWRRRLVHDGPRRRPQSRQNKFRYDAPFVGGWLMSGFILNEQFYRRTARTTSPLGKVPAERSVDLPARRSEML